MGWSFAQYALKFTLSTGKTCNEYIRRFLRCGQTLLLALFYFSLKTDNRRNTLQTMKIERKGHLQGFLHN